MLRVAPITMAESVAYVAARHRWHKKKVPGHKFSVSVVDREGTVRGVAIVGRPCARGLQDGLTLEVRRCCTDGARNACSMLYAAAWRAGLALGYRRIVTYTLEHEPGASLRAAGWVRVRVTRRSGGYSWSCASRPREDPEPGTDVPKQVWMKAVGQPSEGE